MTTVTFHPILFGQATATEVTACASGKEANPEQTLYQAYDAFYRGLEWINDQLRGHAENLGEIERILLDPDSEMTPYGEEKLKEHIPLIRQYLDNSLEYISQIGIADKATLELAKEKGFGGPDRTESLAKLMLSPHARRLIFYNIRANTITLANATKQEIRTIDTHLDRVMDAYIQKKFGESAEEKTA